MLEIPEMERVRRELDNRWVNQRIRDIRVLRESWLTVPVADIEAGLQGKMLLYVERRGKALIFHLDDGRRLLIQIGYGGEMKCVPTEEWSDQIGRAQLSIHFDQGVWHVNGARTLSIQWVTAKELDELLRKWGPDPLSRNLTAEQFCRRFDKRRSALKTALCNPALLSGITPIAADEICYQAGILPNVKTELLTEQDWKSLYDAMVAWLQQAIEDPNYIAYQVTGHTGKSCNRCGGTIVETMIAGKAANHCSHCQSEHVSLPEPAIHSSC